MSSHNRAERTGYIAVVRPSCSNSHRFTYYIGGVPDLPALELIIIYKVSLCCIEHSAKLIFEVKPGDNKILKIFDFEFTWQF